MEKPTKQGTPLGDALGVHPDSTAAVGKVEAVVAIADVVWVEVYSWSLHRVSGRLIHGGSAAAAAAVEKTRTVEIAAGVDVAAVAAAVVVAADGVESAAFLIPSFPTAGWGELHRHLPWWSIRLRLGF